MSHELPFELVSLDAPGDLRPLEVLVREQVTTPFDVRAWVSVPSEVADSAREALFETAATVLIRTPLGPRAFHGVVVQTAIVGEEPQHRTRLEVVIVPKLDLLRFKTQTRVFHDMTTPEIVARVASAVDQRIELRISEPLAPRVYTCQYYETDFSFVERLLADDGLFYWFEHEADGEATMVLADACDAYRPIDGDPRLLFAPATRETAMTVEERQVTSLVSRSMAATKETVTRDYDHRRPLARISARDGAAGGLALVPERERDAIRRTLAHDIHGGSREEARVLGVPPNRVTESLRMTSEAFGGSTACRRLAVGRSFRVDGGPRDVSVELVPLWVELHARSVASDEGHVTFDAKFQAVPKSVPMRPPLRAAKPVAVCETATVVGPEGHEIYTDDLGRVKVQFHWDRDGVGDETSSCWLRVAHPWAGAGFGGQFIPRVGTEVLVGFVGSDPDRPIVQGALFNATHPLPFSLPGEKEKVGFRSRSTGPGDGGGCHELVFDDTRGSEALSLRSQGEMRVTALGSSVHTVFADQRTVIGGVRDESIAGDSSTRVGGGYRAELAQNASLRAGGDTQARFVGSLDLSIGRLDERVEGNVTSTIGGSRISFVGQRSREPVIDSTSVAGSLLGRATHDVSFSGGRCVELRCGDSSIALLPDRIVIRSPQIDLHGHDRIGARQGRDAEASWTLQNGFSTSGGTVSFASDKGATLVLDADASLDGAFVRLNCGTDAPPKRAPGDERSQSGALTFEVVREGIPAGVDEVTLVLQAPDGTRLEKICPVGGSVTVEGRHGDPYVLVEMRAGGQALLVRRLDDGKGG